MNPTPPSPPSFTSAEWQRLTQQENELYLAAAGTRESRRVARGGDTWHRGWLRNWKLAVRGGNGAWGWGLGIMLHYYPSITGTHTMRDCWLDLGGTARLGPLDLEVSLTHPRVNR